MPTPATLIRLRAVGGTLTPPLHPKAIMALILVTPPALEPVTLAEAKAHLRVDAADEDVLIQSLILTSRLQIEAALALALISQSWTLTLDCWPQRGLLEMPIGPLQSVSEIRMIAADGTPSIVDPAGYDVDHAGTPPRIARLAATSLVPGRRLGGIAIDFSAGYGSAASDVPEPIRHALLMLVAHWFENREPPRPRMLPPGIPDAVSDLLLPYRGVRL